MGAELRAVRRRISTVKSTAKITKAQELIASSRIIKAQQRAHAAGPYAREITAAVEAVVSRSANVNHPLTTEPANPTRAAVLILTSDRGFAGGDKPHGRRQERHEVTTSFGGGRDFVHIASAEVGDLSGPVLDMAAERVG